MAACSELLFLFMTTSLDNLKAEIKQAIVRSLRLPITPEEIGDDTSLFERSFGVSIGDEQTGMKVLRSVDTIADYITNERAKSSA